MYLIISFLTTMFILLLYLFYKSNKHVDVIMSEKVNELFKNTFYINLKHRTDRKIETEGELNKMKIKNYKRFDALRGENGHIGCSKSHLEILKQAKKNNFEYVAIVEDDIEFLEPQQTVNKLQCIIDDKVDWDVIILGGIGIKKRLTKNYAKAIDISTTTGYIVKRNYYDKLIDLWEDNLNKLIKSPDEHDKYALDQTWKQLQKKDNFLLLMPIRVVQRSGVSDIQNGFIDYDGIFVNSFNE